MLDFKEITLEDKDWMDQLLQYSDFQGAEYCFTVLYIWRSIYQTKVCRYKDFLLIRSTPAGVHAPHYIFPAGRGSDAEVKEVLELYLADARSLGAPFYLTSLAAEQKTQMERLFPNRFEFTSVRNSFDYIYLAQDLITLRGKRFQPKRNHIARFKELSGWKYEAVTPDNLAECAKMNEEWCALYGCGKDISMAQEACSVRSAIGNFERLGLTGGLLRLDGRVVAYTIGEKLNSDTFIVHIEKAFADIRGAYPAMSQEFLLHQMAQPQPLLLPNGDPNGAITPETIGFTYVNREDDAGDEGLRTAKMQYNPVFLLEKWSVCEK